MAARKVGRAAKRGRDRRGKLRGAIRLASIGLAAAAVTKELRRPKKERTWQGTLGKIPYDFRTPSPKRVKRSLWAPDDPHLFVPRAFGVGWSVNFANVKARGKDLVKQYREIAAGTRPRG
ncbi:MAG TPA: DUF5808 domain-containing protein [Acidothermaceae bacterium]